MSNGSGDYVIAISNAEENRIPYQASEPVRTAKELNNSKMTPLFIATIEATEEAILNSLFTAETMNGRDGHTIEALPKKEVLELMKKYGRLAE